MVQYLSSNSYSESYQIGMWIKQLVWTQIIHKQCMISVNTFVCTKEYIWLQTLQWPYWSDKRKKKKTHWYNIYYHKVNEPSYELVQIWNKIVSIHTETSVCSESALLSSHIASCSVLQVLISVQYVW